MCTPRTLTADIRIVEISGLWKIIYSYFGIKPYKIGKFLFKYQMSGIFVILVICGNFEKWICGNSKTCPWKD